MRILKTIFKTALSIMAMLYLVRTSTLLDGIVGFAGAYGLLSWYIFSFTQGGVLEVVGDGGLFELLFGLVLNLCAPILVLLIPMFILQSFLPGEIPSIIMGVCIILGGVACMVGDFLHMFRVAHDRA